MQGSLTGSGSAASTQPSPPGSGIANGFQSMPVQFGSPGFFTFSTTITFGVSNVSESSAVTSSSGATAATFAFGSTFNISTGFSFGASSSSSFGPTNSAASATTSSLPSSSMAKRQRIGKRSRCAASAGNNDQMNTEDSMAEDSVQSSTPADSVSGQSPVSPSPQGFMFGTTVQPPAVPLQQNQAAPQNPFQFQASSSLDFNAGGGSFSLGSSGPGKSGRKVVKVNRKRNRKRYIF